MKSVSLRQLFGMACVALAAAASVQAAPVAPITNLYNTGMASAWNAPGPGTPLAGTNPDVGSTEIDPHWTVTYKKISPLTTVTTPAHTKLDGVTPFVGGAGNRHQLDLAADPNKANSNLDKSQWISTDIGVANTSFGGDEIAVFETTFSTYLPLTTISISGFLKNSYDVVGIQLNSDPVFDPGLAASFTNVNPNVAAQAFTVTGTGGFTNTLKFFVYRPAGRVIDLRVQFSDATFTVPEPSTLVLGALGLVGYGATRLRRRFFGAAQA